MSALHPAPERCSLKVRFTPDSNHVADIAARLGWTNCCREHLQQNSGDVWPREQLFWVNQVADPDFEP
jgi:hypothetical protein